MIESQRDRVFSIELTCNTAISNKAVKAAIKLIYHLIDSGFYVVWLGNIYLICNTQFCCSFESAHQILKRRTTDLKIKAYIGRYTPLQPVQQHLLLRRSCDTVLPHQHLLLQGLQLSRDQDHFLRPRRWPFSPLGKTAGICATTPFYYRWAVFVRQMWIYEEYQGVFWFCSNLGRGKSPAR